MKILIASDIYYPHINGASYFTDRLATTLAKQGHEVSIIAPSATRRSTRTQHRGVTVFGIRSIGIPLVYPNLRVSPLWFTYGTLRRCVAEVQPDIIHIQNHFLIGRGLLHVAHELNIPIVGTNHFMPENMLPHFHVPSMVEQWIMRWGWHQFRRVYRQLDVVATPTDTAAALLRQIGFTKDVVTISCGIDRERFHPGTPNEALLRRYDIPPQRRVILYVGRLDKEKQIDLIIASLPHIVATVDAHLVVAGVGMERTALEEEATRLGVRDRVTFTGFVADEDLPEMYRLAHLFVMAGMAELQSIVTLEALASGLPVIAVNAMALPELVHDGVNGYLFEEHDVDTLATKATAILQDPALAQRLAKNSLAIIEQHDMKKTIAAYESLYRTTIANHQTRSVRQLRPRMIFARALRRR